MDVLGCTYVLLITSTTQLLIETIRRERVTHIYMVPSQIVALLHQPNFGEDVRNNSSVSAP